MGKIEAEEDQGRCGRLSGEGASTGAFAHSRTGMVAFGILLACLALYFGPRLARGEILYPHTGALEAGVGQEVSTGLQWWYLDVALLYVPETAVHLDPNRSNWLATWTPHSGLGRPLFHVGVGSAFVLARAVAYFTTDPFVHYTWMASLSVILSALFAFGFLRARSLHPAACLGAALAISIGPLYPVWPMIPLAQWGFAWAFAALFGVETWCKRRSLFSLVAIAFAVHGILLTGFMEHALGLGWMVGGWVVLRTLGATEVGRRKPAAKWRLFGGVVLAAILGVISVMPVLADLLLDLNASTRLAESSGLGRRYEGDVWPWIFAVVGGGGPGNYSFSIGAALCALTALGAVRGGAREGALGRWYWIAWLFLMAAATAYEGAFGLLLFLGLGNSVWPPVLTVFLPATYLIALGLHDLFTQVSLGHRRQQFFVVAAVLAAGTIGHLATDPLGSFPLDPALLAGAVGPALLLCLFVLIPKGRDGVFNWLVPLVLTLPNGCVVAKRVVAWKDRAIVHTESELSRAIRLHTRDGSRYVWVGDRPFRGRLMPPNFDAVLKTRGLQSYDHLPTKEFHALVNPLRLEQERRPYIRRFTRLIRPTDLVNEQFAFADLSTVLSMMPLHPALATRVGSVGDVIISEPVRRLPGRFSLPLDRCSEESDDQWSIDYETASGCSEPAGVLEEKNDSLRLAVPDSADERLLFLSQEYHRHWRASADGRRLKTVRVNDLYQGVLLPPGEAEIELEFRPWSLWIALSQLAFLAAGFAGLAQLLRRSTKLFLAAMFTSGLLGCGTDREGAEPSEAAAPHRPDVILLVADTFRADNLGLEFAAGSLSPDLDALARGARSFNNARTPATWTLPAHASLFTARYPREIDVVGPESRIHPDLETLAEAFVAGGYRTAAVTDSGYVSRHFGMDQGFESFVTTGHMSAADFDLTVAAVEEALDQPGDERPLFLFVQSYRAHSWTVGAATRERLGAELAFQPNKLFTSKPWRERFLDLLRVAEHGEPMGGEEFDAVIGSMIPNYRGAAADTAIGFGRVLDLLNARPRFREAAVVFTSDHGEAFGLHGVVSHGNGVWDEQARIPLLISAPWIASGTDERLASLIDLPRTLASLAGIEPAETWRGIDLLAPVNPARSLFLFQTLPAKTCYVAMIKDGVKWIFVDEGDGPGNLAFVYDLEADALEEVDLSASLGAGEAEAQVRRALEDIMRPISMPNVGAQGEMERGLQKQLRAMGYGGR